MHWLKNPAKTKAHDFPQVFKDLGYDLSKLGCIMLDTEPVALQNATGHFFDGKDLYYAKNKSRFWIDGVVAETTPHVTLLYGLLRSGPEMIKHVDAVLGLVEGAEPPKHFPRTVVIDHVDYFPSPYGDEPYYCLVAHLKISRELIECNERLKFLPHINTFPGFKAHITLAYIKADDKIRSKYLNKLSHNLNGKELKVLRINYGGDK